MQKLFAKTLPLMIFIAAMSACVWQEPGRYGRGHDDRGEHHHERGDRGERNGHEGHDDSRHEDDRGDHR